MDKNMVLANLRQLEARYAKAADGTYRLEGAQEILETLRQPGWALLQIGSLRAAIKAIEALDPSDRAFDAEG